MSEVHVWRLQYPINVNAIVKIRPLVKFKHWKRGKVPRLQSHFYSKNHEKLWPRHCIIICTLRIPWNQRGHSQIDAYQFLVVKIFSQTYACDQSQLTKLTNKINVTVACINMFCHLWHYAAKGKKYPF